MANIFHRGNQAYKEEKQERARRRQASARFFITKKEAKNKVSKNIIFLEPISDDQENGTLGLYEHHLCVDGDLNHHYPCTRGLEGYDGCFICESSWRDAKDEIQQFPRYHINVATIIDMSEFELKDGTTIKNVKKLMCLKEEAFERLVRKNNVLIENGQADGLKGHIVSAARIGARAVNTGNEFEVIRKVENPEEITDTNNEPVDMNPFNYEEIFKGQPREFYEELFKSHQVTPPFVKGASQAQPVESSDGQSEIDY